MTETKKPNDTLAVPLKLDAFVLNEEVCNGKTDEGKVGAKIAPITQSNYTFLRLENNIVQNDILPHVDLHTTSPADVNPRLTDLGDGSRRENRKGVYLHWMLPRFYRSAVADTESSVPDRNKDGYKPPNPQKLDKAAPQFRLVPVRWMVIRRLHTASPTDSGIPEYQAWVVESDRRRDINNPEDVPLDADLQVDLSPFVHLAGDEKLIRQQAEIFTGQKFPVEDWEEKGNGVERVPITVLNGGNVLFTDFQHHNGSVFSIVDNFAYRKQGKTEYLETATASYYVIGWHPDQKDDPFHIVQPEQKSPGITRTQRLASCQMEFNNPDHPSPAQNEWRESPDSADVVCHGAMYQVEWNATKKPENVLADEHSANLQENQQVAVGTTPLDSLLAYINSHRDGWSDPDIKRLMDDIERLQKFLIMQEDTVDSQQQAGDLLLNYNYDAVTGGITYHLPGQNGTSKPAQPPGEQVVTKLAELNQEQFRLDAIVRTEKTIRWKLFSLWWKFIAEGANTPSYRVGVKDIMEEWDQLQKAKTESAQNVAKLLDKKQTPELDDAQPAALPRFYQQRDPTLLVGNVESGWPYDWLGELRVRLNTEIAPAYDGSNLDRIIDQVKLKKLPERIQETVGALLGEFSALDTETPISKPHSGTFFPLYHDLDKASRITPTPWRDRWGKTQPWFPLFLEWEVEYSHIPLENWSLEERPAADGTQKLRYGIRKGTNLVDLNAQEKPDDRDTRTLSGRVLILPQPTASLESKIIQLHDSTPEAERKKIMNDDEWKWLRANLRQLPFLSSPLAGFHDHLVTVAQGTHIKPTIRRGGEKLTPLAAAFNSDANFREDQFEIMSTETDVTPYANMVPLYDFKHSAFKPATHGQFKFTKLNVIDKFGQAIHALDPKWRGSKDPSPALYPSVSEFYAPQASREMIPNTVEEPHPSKANEFVQIGPHVNQLARINAKFMKRATDGEAWVPQTEWENPVWGWLVINYVEYGIQVFLADGTFYREVRLGGKTGASQSDRWLPFEAPSKKEKNEKPKQVDYLLEKLRKPDYLRSFIDMIIESIDNTATPPDAYTQFLNNVIGRPLALVNMGWSLELAVNEYENQSKLNNYDPDEWLLPAPSGHRERKTYKFPFKLGDKQRSYDGLVGYFPTIDKRAKDSQNDLDLDKCYTYFGVGSRERESPLIPISSENYPDFEPYFFDPKSSAEAINTKRNSYLAQNAYGAILDPFTAVHAYSGLLPTKPLKLTTWVWQEALSRMTAFFHAGPLVVTKDVPDYNPKYRLGPSYDVEKEETIPGSTVGVPAMAAAEWNWLQPYSVKEGGSEVTSYMPLGLGHTDTRPRFEDPPYSVIEGYLQMKKPIISPVKR